MLLFELLILRLSFFHFLHFRQFIHIIFFFTQNFIRNRKRIAISNLYATEIDLLLRRKQILIPLQNKIDDNNTDNISNGILTANELRLNSRVCQC